MAPKSETHARTTEEQNPHQAINTEFCNVIQQQTSKQIPHLTTKSATNPTPKQVNYNPLQGGIKTNYFIPTIKTFERRKSQGGNANPQPTQHQTPNQAETQHLYGPTGETHKPVPKLRKPICINQQYSDKPKVSNKLFKKKSRNLPTYISEQYQTTYDAKITAYRHRTIKDVLTNLISANTAKLLPKNHQNQGTHAPALQLYYNNPPRTHHVEANPHTSQENTMATSSALKLNHNKPSCTISPAQTHQNFNKIQVFPAKYQYAASNRQDKQPTISFRNHNKTDYNNNVANSHVKTHKAFRCLHPHHKLPGKAITIHQTAAKRNAWQITIPSRKSSTSHPKTPNPEIQQIEPNTHVTKFTASTQYVSYMNQKSSATLKHPFRGNSQLAQLAPTLNNNSPQHHHPHQKLTGKITHYVQTNQALKHNKITHPTEVAKLTHPKPTYRHTITPQLKPTVKPDKPHSDPVMVPLITATIKPMQTLAKTSSNPTHNQAFRRLTTAKSKLHTHYTVHKPYVKTTKAAIKPKRTNNELLRSTNKPPIRIPATSNYNTAPTSKPNKPKTNSLNNKQSQDTILTNYKVETSNPVARPSNGYRSSQPKVESLRYTDQPMAIMKPGPACKHHCKLTITKHKQLFHMPQSLKNVAQKKTPQHQNNRHTVNHSSSKTNSTRLTDTNTNQHKNSRNLHPQPS
eukprot:gene2914-1896_t